MENTMETSVQGLGFRVRKGFGETRRTAQAHAWLGFSLVCPKVKWK